MDFAANQGVAFAIRELFGHINKVLDRNEQ